MVTTHFPEEAWPLLPRARAEELIQIPDYEASGCSFITHHYMSLDLPRVNEIRQSGDPVLCWTIKSEDDEHEARRLADNITFEGYLP